MRILWEKGSISAFTIPIVGAIASVIVALVGAMATTNTRAAATDAKVQVLEERENNHYSEVQKQLTTIDKKLDAVSDLLKKK